MGTLFRITFERGLAIFLACIVIFNSYIYIRDFAGMSWSQRGVLFAMYLVMTVLVCHLYHGSEDAYELGQVFYWAQVPATLGLGHWAFDLDAGIKAYGGWLNKSLRFGFLAGHTNFFCGFLGPDDGTSEGIVINFAALALAIYFTLRRRSFDV